MGFCSAQVGETESLGFRICCAFASAAISASSFSASSVLARGGTEKN
jgi:hypothetical protein